MVDKSSRFLVGLKLLRSQIQAMFLKKFLYSIRKYMTLVIQFLTAPLIVVYTVMSHKQGENINLPALAISFKEYLKTVTTMENGTFANDSVIGKTFGSYMENIQNLADKHELKLTEKSFDDEILSQYASSMSNTNLHFMVGASFKDNNITAWFNNQAFHTAPLTVNLLNNAILR